jgi:hypothetical protein
MPTVAWYLVLTLMSPSANFAVRIPPSVVVGPLAQEQCETMRHQITDWRQPVLATCAQLGDGIGK